MQPVLASSIAWGDFPSWVSAAAAILALAAAVFAAWYVRGQQRSMNDQVKLMEQQGERDRERAEHDREEIARQRAELLERDQLLARAQAERIDVMPGKHRAELQGIDPETFLTLSVRNNSNRPIRSLRVRANPQGGDDPTHDMDLHIGHLKDRSHLQPIKSIGDPPLTFMQDKGLRSPLALLRRDEWVTFLLALAADRWPVTRYWLQFEDDAGLLWELDSDMHLRRIEARWSP